ncbi:MAG: translation initiation factor IF-1 [Patescibacteria group bacterium]
MPAPSNAAPLRREGIIDEALGSLKFRIRFEDGKEILGHLAGKLRLHHIRVVAGDKVQVEISPDGRLGRIIRRL